MGKVVRAPFGQGQVSIGARTFEVEGGVVVGLLPGDIDFVELERAFGLTVENGKPLAKPAKPTPPPKKVDGGGD